MKILGAGFVGQSPTSASFKEQTLQNIWFVYILRPPLQLSGENVENENIECAVENYVKLGIQTAHTEKEMLSQPWWIHIPKLTMPKMIFMGTNDLILDSGCHQTLYR